MAQEPKPLPHQCEFTCQGCGKKEPGVYGYDHAWHKPSAWFERSDEAGAQTACSRSCIDIVSRRSGKTGCVLPV